MYGLGSILSSLGTAAAAPAISTATMSAVTDSMKGADWLKGLIADEGARKFLSEAAGGTLGTALSMGLGAGLGAATGGSSGAAGGALTGLVSGAGAAMQHDKFKDAMGLGALEQEPEQVNLKGVHAQLTKQNQGIAASATPGETLKGMDVAAIQELDKYGLPRDEFGTTISTAPTAPTTAAAAGKGKILDKDKPSYFELTAGLGMPALTLGMGLTSGLQEGQAARAHRKKKQQEEEARLAEIAAMGRMIYGSSGYAEGGGLSFSPPTSPQTTVKFPQWFVDEFAKSGGLQSLAQGGYINTQEFDPDMAHPQSQIPRAQHYPAAAPIRNEVLDFADGGLLEGDGDGMSDDIPANIEGQEEIRVADGEFIVPKRIAEQYGEDALEDMMDAVRHAVHAKKGKQPQQDAAKRAFIRTMSGIKA